MTLKCCKSCKYWSVKHATPHYDYRKDDKVSCALWSECNFPHPWSVIETQTVRETDEDCPQWRKKRV